ncbi:transglutaminase TgpA family protein [Alkaliphilus transvaalensis]|uniref:transglutaminase TgpA family protein n=1 Tax=Alkaliphilus transvaalensis TaxID=114628 RepID=UPI00047EBCD0|nr:transglutaminaseTgpA domain-containing protein [Alkaliphilus transvaalensis]
MEHKTTNILYRILIYVFIVFSLSNLWGIVLDVAPNSVVRLILTAVVAILIHLIASYPFYWIIISIASIIPLLILNRYQSELIYEFLSKAQQLYSNVIQYFRGTEQISTDHLTAFWLLITALLCLCTWVIMIKAKRTWILLPLYILFFIYYWYIYIDAAYWTMMFFLILYFILMGVEGYGRAEKRWIKEAVDFQQEGQLQWIKTALVYGILIVLIASILPKKNNLIESNQLEMIVTQRFPIVMNLRDDLVYSRSFGQALLFNFSETGFQESSNELGGPVRISDDIVMEVKTPIPLYLRGNIKTTYENNRWEIEKIPQYNYQTRELLSREVELGRIIEIEINNVNMATYTIFTPYQPLRIITESPGRIFVDDDFLIIRESGTYKNESYKVQAILPFNVEARASVEGPKLNVDYIERYLQLPDNLPLSVTQLANDITKVFNSPYQKAEAIQNYLRNNYNYSLEPSITPEGRDFVEFFLFEEQEGYCTYFATAMAVMLRTQGIPTRYIEGYRTPQEAVDDLYVVRQNNAHAWVEAYIDGIGWVAFEPTPAYQPPALTTGLSGVNEDDSEVPFDEWEAILQYELEAMERESNDIVIDTSIEENRPINNLPQESQWTLKKIRDHLLTIIYGALILLLILRITYNYFRMKKYLVKIIEDEASISVPSLYQNILDTLAEMGHPIEKGETPYEYSQRIIPNIYDKTYNFRYLTEVFIKVRYGRHQVEKTQVQDLINYLKIIDKKLKVQIGFWKYHYKKYIKGTMYKNYDN